MVLDVSRTHLVIEVDVLASRVGAHDQLRTLDTFNENRALLLSRDAIVLAEEEWMAVPLKMSIFLSRDTGSWSLFLVPTRTE